MQELQQIYVGVDTHSRMHVAFALDALGRHAGSISVPNDLSGYRQLLAWSVSLGDVVSFGVEGTGSYGAQLGNYLRFKGHIVLEVARPSRQDRRRKGKSDLVDAEIAARSLLSGHAFSPKIPQGPVESLRMLRSVKISAIKSRTQTINQVHAILATGPYSLTDELRSLPLRTLLHKCARFRTSTSSTPEQFAKLCLKSLSRRHQSLTAEISALEEAIRLCVLEACPDLLDIHGIGVDTASSLLVAVGHNPQRLASESSFAHLSGVAPLPASSGKTTRYRLNRGGNRDANRALHVVALVRMAHDPRTKEYVSRRTTEGKTKKEIIRCLKRYIAREVFRVISAKKTSESSLDNL